MRCLKPFSATTAPNASLGSRSSPGARLPLLPEVLFREYVHVKHVEVLVVNDLRLPPPADELEPAPARRAWAFGLAARRA